MSKSLMRGYVVEKTAKRMKQSFSRILTEEQENITVDQWILLEQLASKDRISQLELGKDTFKDAPTVTRIIDILVKKKMVERVMDKNDRRKFNIKLTSIGVAKYKRINELAIQFRAKIYEGLDSEDVNRLQSILDTINNNLMTK